MKWKKRGGREMKKTIKIKELGIEVMPKQAQNNVKFKDIEIPKGWRLIKATEIMKFWYNKKFRDIVMKINDNDVWFFVEDLNIYKKKYVARFFAYSDGAFLVCYRDSGDSNSGLGVIFVRDLKEVK